MEGARWRLIPAGPHPFPVLLALALAVLVGACDLPSSRPTPLDDLVLRDSIYHGPDGIPFTGAVERRFPEDTTQIQLTGFLREGTWQGELRVYHRNGRIRFPGALHEGAPCGEWIEEQPPEAPGSVYEQLVDEIESLSVYDPCP